MSWGCGDRVLIAFKNVCHALPPTISCEVLRFRTRLRTRLRIRLRTRLRTRLRIRFMARLSTRLRTRLRPPPLTFVPLLS